MDAQQYNKSHRKTLITTMNRTNYRPSKKPLTQQAARGRTNHSPFRSQKSFQEQGDKSEQMKMQMLLNRDYPVTTTNWCLFDSRREKWVGVREGQQREVASLTKIMTVVVSLELFQKYRMERDIMVRVSASSASQTGTTAELRENRYLCLYDLMYGAMLPSGNDAALLLAQVFGLLLFYESVKPQSKDYSQIQSIDLTCYESTSTFVSRFLKQMNKKAKELQMKKTIYTNPHGLSNILNVSSAKDQVTLSRYCWKNEKFRQLANCKQFKSKFYKDDMVTVHCTKIWKNTNKLLGLGWEGIKTGNTNPAGSCLASYRDGVFIVVLNSATREARFDDTAMLWEWYGRQKQEE